MDRFWFDTLDRLTFAFQPIVSRTDGRILAVEALLRGTREAGFRSIQDVFDLAATDHKLMEFETALREKALRLFALLPLDDDVRLFCNLDNRIFRQPDWKPGTLLSLLDRVGIPSRRLVLEISERHAYFPEDGQWEGVEFALDDFGTGHSGLKTFLRVQPAFVKLDRHFVRDIDQDLSRQKLWESLIVLGRSLGAQVIAEGVESPGELAYCLDSDCDAIQGFAISQPLFAGQLFPAAVPRSQGLLFLPS